MLVTGDFVEAYLGQDRSAHEEAEALIWLAENVIGARQQAPGRPLAGRRASPPCASRRRCRYGAGQRRPRKLASLADAAARRRPAAAWSPEDYAPIQAKLGELGGLIEADAKLVAAVARAQAPPLHRLTAAAAAGLRRGRPRSAPPPTAPAPRPCASSADETRAELAAAPEQRAARSAT